MENLLYYPYINIPDTDWTARALLYYDKVGTIVPREFFYEPDNYSPFMRAMLSTELIEPIDPARVLSQPWEVARPFINYIKSEGFNLEKRRDFFQNGRYFGVHKQKLPFGGSRIHVDKFEWEIFYQLQQAGLAVKLDRSWYLVERKTANDLMEFLASVIGAKIQYRPTTDGMRKRMKSFGESKKEYEAFKIENNKREQILNELIPFPEQIDIAKLRKFKDKHLDLLKSFKNKVEQIVLNASIEEGSPLFNETIDELKTRKIELTEKMNESHLGNIFFGGICGITSAGVSLCSSDTRVAVIGGLAGLASAIYTALQIERAEDIFDQSGMKYLALIDKRLRSNFRLNEEDKRFS